MSADTGSGTETYTYAGDGTRLSATASGSTTDFVWDRNQGLPQLAQLRDGGGALVACYTYGAKRVSQTVVGASTSFYHPDGLGSVTDVTDGTGGSLAWTEYYPFGDARETALGTGAPATQPFGFAGEQFDGTTGLYYLRARQYDPSTGRFLTTDPLPPSMYRPCIGGYAYGRNRPTILIDPTGLAAEKPSQTGTCWQIAGPLLGAAGAPAETTDYLLTGAIASIEFPPAAALFGIVGLVTGGTTVVLLGIAGKAASNSCSELKMP